MKISHFSLLFLLILLLSGCFFRFDKKPVKRIQPEILLAQSCGFDKLPCCASSPVCNFGQQCCANPNNGNENYCSDDCSCGGEDEFCCENLKCGDGLTCRNSICSKCGEEGDICCPGVIACSSALACLNDECVKCGESGNPCCKGSNPCQIKKGDNVECFNDICRSCGFDGFPACLGAEACLDNQILTGGRCERCGELNRPCCNIDLFGYDCDKSKKLTCNLGFCAEIE